MPTHGPRTRMVEHVRAYLERRKPQVSPRTHDSLRSTLLRFSDWQDEDGRKVPRNVTERDIEVYVWGAHECERRCRPPVHYGPGLRATLGDAALNRSLGQLSGFLSWAVRYGHMRPEVLEPVHRDRRVRARRLRRRRLDADQLTELYEGCDDPLERIVCALSIYTAGRASELSSLRVGDVDLDAGEIAWTRHKIGEDDDYLPITAELAKELAQWFDWYQRECGALRPDWYLIPARYSVGVPGVVTYYPDRPRVRGPWLIVKKHLARVLDIPEAELRGEGVHTVRRSMARCLYERLCEDQHPDPVSVVQALLGHASRAMTERYIGVETGRRERDRLLRGQSMLGRR